MCYIGYHDSSLGVNALYFKYEKEGVKLMSKKSNARAYLKAEILKIALQVAQGDRPTESNIGASWGRLEVEFKRRYGLDFDKEMADLPTLMLALATAKYMVKVGWVNIDWKALNGVGGEISE